MTDIPILFNGPMVLAQLEGRKTMTRRLAWRNVIEQVGTDYHPLGNGPPEPITRLVKKPTHWQKVKPGDRLWVRETWRTHAMFDGLKPRDITARSIHYVADGSAKSGKTRVSIHMPRWASRITWIVTDVKIEPVQEISERDALAEGIARSDPTPEDLEWYRNWAPEQGIDPATDPMQPVWLAPGTKQGWGLTKEERNCPQWGPTPEFAFRCLWDSLHAKSGNGWADNPEVVAITGEVHIRNIDDMEN